MTPVDQQVTACPQRGDGANPDGVPGDCLRAAVATLLDLPYDQVPHFALYGYTWWDQLRRWARTRGLDFGCLPADHARRVLADQPGALLIARGPSPRRTRGGHVVVADTALRTVWDPHPSRAGLLAVDEVYVVTVPYGPPPEQRALPAGRVGPPPAPADVLPSTA